MPKKQTDPRETKDAATKQRTQTQTPQMQSHEDCAQEVEEHGETPQEVDDDSHRQRQPWEPPRESHRGGETDNAQPWRK